MQAWWPEAFARPDSRIVASSGEKWESRHEDVWQREIPLLTLADVSTELSGNPWFALLSRRQKDLLLVRLRRVKHGSAPSVRAIALQVSLGWGARGGVDGGVDIPTLVLGSLIWLVREQRLTLGIEAARLQGVDVCDLPALAPGTHIGRFSRDLAGNAFCVYQFSAWLLACLATTELGTDSSIP